MNENRQPDLMQSQLTRNFAGVEHTDDIGLLDILAQQIEQLETSEAVDHARYEAQARGPALDDERDVRQGFGSSPDSTQHDMLRFRASRSSQEPDEVDPRRQGPSSAERRNSSPREDSHAENDVGEDDDDERGPLRPVAPFGARGHILFSKRLQNYFATLGSTREKRVIALSAWGISVMALLIVLIFVTKDFMEGRKSATTAVNLQLVDNIDIPNMFVCNKFSAFPPFLQQPSSNFSGQPLLWVQSMRLTSQLSDPLFYPDTHKHPNIGQVSMNSLGEACEGDETRYADAGLFSDALSQPPTCFHCIHVKNSPAISISRQDVEDSAIVNGQNNLEAGGNTDFWSSIGGNQPGTLAIVISENLILESCRLTRNGMEGRAFYALVDILAANYEELQERGIMYFSGYNATLEEDQDVLFPNFRLRSKFGYTDIASGDVVDAMCNTFLFSGFFYPAPPTQDVRFRFEPKTNRWARSGAGPYFPRNYSYTFVEPELEDDGGVVPNQFVGFKTTGTNSLELPNTPIGQTEVTSGRSMEILVEGRGDGERVRQLSAIKNTGAARISFQLEVERNVSRYDATSDVVPLFSVDGRNLNLNYFLVLTSRNFMTPVISEQVTVQFSSFLADFFGLIELFLDLSVYTLIISPIVVATRRRALLARARAHAAAEDDGADQIVMGSVQRS